MTRSVEQGRENITIRINKWEWLTQAIARELEMRWIHNTTKLELLRLATSASKNHANRKKEDIYVGKWRYTVVNPVYENERYTISINTGKNPQKKDPPVTPETDSLTRRADINSYEEILSKQIKDIDSEMAVLKKKNQELHEEFWYILASNGFTQSAYWDIWSSLWLTIEIVTWVDGILWIKVTHKLWNKVRDSIISGAKWFHQSAKIDDWYWSALKKLDAVSIEYNNQQKRINDLKKARSNAIQQKTQILLEKTSYL